MDNLKQELIDEIEKDKSIPPTKEVKEEEEDVEENILTTEEYRTALNNIKNDLELSGGMSRDMAVKIHQLTDNFLSIESDLYMYTEVNSTVGYKDTLQHVNDLMVSVEELICTQMEACNADIKKNDKNISATTLELVNHVAKELSVLERKYRKVTGLTKAASKETYKKFLANPMMVSVQLLGQQTYVSLADMHVSAVDDISESVTELKVITNNWFRVAQLHSVILGDVTDINGTKYKDYTIKDMYRLITLSATDILTFTSTLHMYIEANSNDLSKINALLHLLREYLIFLKDEKLLKFLQVVTAYTLSK